MVVGIDDDGAAVALHDVARDREPQPGAAGRLIAGAVEAGEPFEHLGMTIRWDARPVVGDGQRGGVVVDSVNSSVSP